MKTILWQTDKENPDTEVLQQASTIIKNDGLVAFPTETVYGLGANGLSQKAVEKIFIAKGRPSDNPLILHIANKDDLQKLAKEIPLTAKKLIDKFWPGPLTIVVKKADGIPDNVTAGLDTVAVRMPLHPIAQQLIKLSGVPIAAPSANTSGKPSPTQAKAVIQDLWAKIDGIIDAGDTSVGLESTVVDCSGKVPILLRPGGITKEQLIEVLGEVQDCTVQDEQTPRSPGMKYKHYAPNAPIYIINDAISDQILLEKIKLLEQKNIIVGVLAEVDFIPKMPKNVVAYGFMKSNQGLEDLATNLYSWLRLFDEQKVKIIFARGVPTNGIGKAIMNRLQKAAGFQEINKIEEFRENSYIN